MEVVYLIFCPREPKLCKQYSKFKNHSTKRSCSIWGYNYLFWIGIDNYKKHMTLKWPSKVHVDCIYSMFVKATMSMVEEELMVLKGNLTDKESIYYLSVLSLSVLASEQTCEREASFVRFRDDLHVIQKVFQLGELGELWLLPHSISDK